MKESEGSEAHKKENCEGSEANEGSEAVLTLEQKKEIKKIIEQNNGKLNKNNISGFIQSNYGISKEEADKIIQEIQNE